MSQPSRTPPSSRRTFLGAVGRVAAVSALPMPMVVPASALGRGGAAPPSERIRIGHIGVKNQGTGNLKALLADTVAVCDVDSEVLGKAKELVEKATGRTIADRPATTARLLDRKDIDAVVVTTPDHWHALITVDACAAGKDVYCEKPLTLTVAEGRAMVDAARKHSRVVQTGSQQRSDDKFRLACELVRNGKLGRPQGRAGRPPRREFQRRARPRQRRRRPTSTTDLARPGAERPYNVNRVHYNFRFFWDYSGGQMTNWGAHHLDIVQWALGMDESGPVAVEGAADVRQGRPLRGAEDVRRSVYTYADGGLVVTCEQGQGDPGRRRRSSATEGTLYVTRGKLEADPADLLKRRIRRRGHPAVRRARTTTRTGWTASPAAKLPICDVEIGHRSATVCHLGNIAARLGRKIDLGPARTRSSATTTRRRRCSAGPIARPGSTRRPEPSSHAVQPVSVRRDRSPANRSTADASSSSSMSQRDRPVESSPSIPTVARI